MNKADIFESEMALPDAGLAAKEKTLLGFEVRYSRVRNQLRLLLNISELAEWNQEYHDGRLALCDLVTEQYPLVIFHGDVGTGKTVMAECIANRLIKESKTEDSVLFKLGNRVRGSGKVGEMGTLLIEAFEQVAKSAGKGRRAILIIDEGDSLATTRSQDHSHHEDKVAVNTLIQRVDDLRRFGGRVCCLPLHESCFGPRPCPSATCFGHRGVYASIRGRTSRPLRHGSCGTLADRGPACRSG